MGTSISRPAISHQIWPPVCHQTITEQPHHWYQSNTGELGLEGNNLRELDRQGRHLWEKKLPEREDIREKERREKGDNH